MNVFIHRTYHILSPGGLQFQLIEIERQLRNMVGFYSRAFKHFLDFNDPSTRISYQLSVVKPKVK